MILSKVRAAFFKVVAILYSHLLLTTSCPLLLSLVLTIFQFLARFFYTLLLLLLIDTTAGGPQRPGGAFVRASFAPRVPEVALPPLRLGALRGRRRTTARRQRQRWRGLRRVAFAHGMPRAGLNGHHNLQRRVFEPWVPSRKVSCAPQPTPAVHSQGLFEFLSSICRSCTVSVFLCFSTSR